ncbi:MAG: CapA family protein [Methylocystaceae bacterium]
MSGKKWYIWPAVALLMLLGCGLYILIDQPGVVAAVFGPRLKDKPVVPQKVTEKRLTIGAVGDIMLARKLNTYMTKYGYGHPVKNIGGDLASSDITFGNLESPIGTTGSKMPGKGICFRADPRSVATLNGGGFDVLSVANNHMLDYDEPAFNETLALLKANSIAAVGGGVNLEAAREPVIINKNGLKIAFLAYSDMADLYFSSSYPRKFQAEEDTPGVAPTVRDLMLEDVTQAGKMADMVVVSLHWGWEYNKSPTEAQRLLAHELVDAGANLIIGHHPHVYQGIESYGGGVIAYSLGNFIFDQNQSLETREGLVLSAFVTDKGLQEVRVRPVFITEGQPNWCPPEQNQELLAEIARLSRNLATEGVLNNNYLSVQL